jgi:hypothetical protein
MPGGEKNGAMILGHCLIFIRDQVKSRAALSFGQF